MFNSTMTRSAAVVLLGLAFVSGCGDDDGSDSDTGDPAPAAEAVGAVDDSDTGAETGSNDGDGGSTRLRAVASAFKTTYKAERVEVDGDTVHIYPGDSPLLRYGVECELAKMLFPDDATLVIHRDGEATTCE